MKKVYNLTIIYDTESDVIEFVDEVITTERPSFTIGNVDVSEVCDSEILDLIDKSHVLGET